MATLSKNTRVIIGTLDLSTHLTNASVAINSERVDVSTFQSDPTFVLLDPDAVFEFSGYYIDAPNGVEQALYDALSTPAVGVTMHWGTNGDPSIAYHVEDVPTENLTVSAPVDGLIAVSGSFVEAAPHRGPVLGWGTITDTNPLTAVDMGATGVVRIYMIMHDLGGGTGVQVHIEDSADGATGWATVHTESFSSTRIAEIDSTISNRYARMSVSNLGGGTGPTLTVLMELA